MSLVVDASTVIAALTNDGTDGIWARLMLQSDNLVSCHHLPSEVAKVLRRMELATEISPSAANVAHSELLVTRIELHAYEAFAPRVWQLRHTVTIQDGWYVALAEWLDEPLLTLDMHLTRAPGPRCRFLTPPP